MVIQDYIRSHQNWKEELSAAPYNLKIQEKGNLVLFKYNQILSDFNEVICREARGLILERGTWDVVRVAFDKFFNLGESHASEIDWSTATATQKEDGSLMSLYFYGGKWNIASNGSIDAFDAELAGGQFRSFGMLFLHALLNSGINMGALNPEYTYTFELCSPYNKVVCTYEDITLYHTLTRSNKTLEEVEQDIGVQKPRFYDLNSQEEYQALVDALPENTEGIVIKDGHGRRVKLKTPLYFELHHMINNGQVTLEKVVTLIRQNDYEEFLSYFGEWADYFTRVKEKMDKVAFICKEIGSVVSIWKDANKDKTRKDFAEFAKAQEYPSLYFAAYDGRLDEMVDRMTIKQFISTFKLEEN